MVFTLLLRGHNAQHTQFKGREVSLSTWFRGFSPWSATKAETSQQQSVMRQSYLPHSNWEGGQGNVSERKAPDGGPMIMPQDPPTHTFCYDLLVPS